MEAMAVRKTEGLPPDMPPASSDLVPFNIRLPRGLIAALDARVREINQQRKWTKINRSDLIRELLMRGIDEQSGGVPNNLAMSAGARMTLAPLQQQHAPGSHLVGEVLAGNLQAGQFIEIAVQLQPGKGYTGIGQGAQPVTVELVAQMGNMKMAASTAGLISLLGSGKDCYKNPTPIPVSVLFRVVAHGSGPVSAALYER